VFSGGEFDKAKLCGLNRGRKKPGELVSRFGVSMDQELPALFDRWLEAHKYKNRSEAIRVFP